jgi:hypothetical protein
MLNPRITRICFFICCLSGYLRAQPPAFRMQSYIEMYSEEAIYQMLEYKIPASVTLAQAIFESQSGGSFLARKSNNHFGIKCHLEWGGDTVAKHDDTLNECFRKYRLVADSYTDHSMFLRSRARYASLFDLPLDDYRSWCYGLKAAGYATYPSYAEDLITLIEQFRLYELDGYQSLAAINVFNQKNHEMVPGPPLPNCSLQELARTGLLWTDEKYLLVQSLELLIEGPPEAEDALAEQPVIKENKSAETQAFSETSCSTSEKKATEKTVEAAKLVPAEIIVEVKDEEAQSNVTNGIVLPEEMKRERQSQSLVPCYSTETANPEQNGGPLMQASAEDAGTPDEETQMEDKMIAEQILSGFDYVKP